jgi:ribonuclease BN (tRNA processing enzyme)
MVLLSIHGPRGSTAFDSPATRHYGGNSSCYSLCSDKDMIILDAGTGILAAEKLYFERNPENLTLLLSHMHHDHIEGLGLSAFPYIDGTDLRIIGPPNVKEGLEARFNSNNFPVSLDDKPGITEVTHKFGLFKLRNDIPVVNWVGNHPLHGSMGYKIYIGGKVIAYATDMEFDFEAPGKPIKSDVIKQTYTTYVSGADVLIADGHFTKEEYEAGKGQGWGHSYPEQIAEMAIKAGVKHLVISHHAPRRTDIEILEMEKNLEQFVEELKSEMTTEFALQGKVIIL